MTTTVQRPEPPHTPPDGFHWEAIETDRDKWRLATWHEQRYRVCRNSPVHKCANMVTMATARTATSHGPVPKTWVRWWLYCDEHAYGRWIEHTRILQWRLVADV